MEINPISDNEVGAVEVPDNGLTPEQIGLINEQVELSEELSEVPEPSTEGGETTAQTPSADSTEQPEPEPKEPEQQEEEPFDVADLPNYLNTLDIDGDGKTDLPESTRAGLSMGFGMVDGATDLVNWGLKTALRGAPDAPQIPKFNAYEDQLMQASRRFAAYAAPQGAVSSVVGNAAKATKAGQILSRTPIGRFTLDATADLAGAAAVTEVSSYTYDDYNMGNMLQDQTAVPMPAFMDGFIQDWAIQPGDTPEKIKEKNRAEEFGMSLLGPLLGYGVDLASIRLGAKPIEITGVTQLSEDWMTKNKPKPIEFADDAVLSAKIKSDEAYAELGEYNRYIANNDPDIPIRGVDDMFDDAETGVRTVDDFGVVGGSVDAAQIANNAGTTYGRIRNMISAGALKHAVNEPNVSGDIVLGLAKSLKDADQYVATGPGWKVDFDQILKAGDDLVVDMIDPKMGPQELRTMLEPFVYQTEDGVDILRESGFQFVLGATKKMMSEYTAMDAARAQAYLVTSLAGQAADISEGLRLNRGGSGVKFAQERIRDNLQMMLKLKAQTNYFKKQKAGLADLFERNGTIRGADTKSLKDNYSIFQENLNLEIAQFGRDLDFIYKDYPELGEALSEMIEVTDGRVFTIDALNETMANSFKRGGGIRVLFDANPDTPNLIGSAIRGNVMNSMLSSIEVPLKALYGNISGTVFEPFNMMAGAMMRGDLKSVQDYWMAYTAIGDTMGKSLDMAGKMFTKASQNDPKLRSATDLDFSIKVDNKINAMEKVARIEADRGNTGYARLVELYRNLIDMSRHPAMRFNSNLMTGMDGMTQATFANAEARFRAMDLMRETDGAVDPSELAKIANQEYNKMFDDNGILIDRAAAYQADEVALRLDNPMAAALRGGSEKFPILNILFPFKGTMTNIVKQFDDTAPAPFTAFQRDVNELMHHDVEWFANHPIKVRELLEGRGYNVDSMTKPAQLATVTRLRDHVRGRKATTTVLMSLATIAASHDRITGDGFYDKEKQQSRVANANWEPRSIKLPNGTYITWSNILPPGVENWLAGWLTAVDNFDSLGENGMENIHKKFMHIFGGALGNDAGLSVIEPIVQILNGNEAALQRWAAHQSNSAAPLAGARKDLSNLLDSGLKILEPNIMDHIKNRNRMVAPFTEELPQLTNPLDGTQPNDYGFLHRIINKISPVKVHNGPSELGQFLHDIEYNQNMLFKTYQGVRLKSSERAELLRIAADQGIWRDGVKKAKKLADARGTIATLKEAQQRGMTSKQIMLDDFDGIFTEVDNAKEAAEEAAFNALPGDVQLQIQDRIEEKQRNQLRSQAGNILEQVPTR